MQPARSEASLLNLPGIPEIKSLVEGSLAHDWIVRVEHTEEVQATGLHWQQWGDSMFAITDAAPVIDQIVACRADFPTHNIRLHAEKVRPRARMYYPVYRRSEQEPEAATGSLGSLASLPHLNEWFSFLGKSARTARSRAWRIATIAGMLIASLLAIEEVMIS